jgi:hypothetical protein
MNKENKYAFLLYTIISVGFVLAMVLISEARAESIVIKNKCAPYLNDDPAGWPCYNDSQGLDNPSRLARYKQIRRKARAQGVNFKGIVVVLNDATCNPNRCFYKFHAKGNRAYLPLMDCPQDFSEGIKVLKQADRASR